MFQLNLFQCKIQGGQKTWNNLEFDKLGKTKTWNFIEKPWKNLELFFNLNFLANFL